MKLRLIKEQGPCPPDGFRYVDPVDGFVAHAWAYNDWVPLEAAHMSANGRQVPPDLGEQMQDQLCKTLPPGWCLYDDESRPRPSASLDWGSLVNGLQTFARWFATGKNKVNQAEANRRALICSRCYLNVPITGCSGCQKLVGEVLGNAQSKYDFALRGCGVCKCVLRAKIHFPIDILKKEAQQLQELYPEHCWLKEGGENYRD